MSMRYDRVEVTSHQQPEGRGVPSFASDLGPLRGIGHKRPRKARLDHIFTDHLAHVALQFASAICLPVGGLLTIYRLRSPDRSKLPSQFP